MTTPTGEANGNARLTEEQVAAAKRLRAEGETFVFIAQKFGVHEATVRRAVGGASWPDVDRRPNEKRLQELEYAKAKLKALVEVMLVVRGDSTARLILEEVLDSTADGTGTHVADLQDLFTVAYAHAMVLIEKEYDAEGCAA